MSTLELIWDATTTYNLWSWTDGKAHHTARLVRQIKNTVFIAHIGPHGAEPAQVVALKIAHGAEAVEELEREAGFYANQLKPLQGVVVPKCYGFYRAKINRTPLACLILEYCAGVPGEKLRDINRKAMRAAYAVHAAGVLHGDLLNGHHFVHMGRDLRIIDFTVAVSHQCIHDISRRAHGHGHHRQCGCPELAGLEEAYGRHA
ncbi:hypothetical protein C8J57DRAFT_1084107 [Mycena rebaudengoi]|nr:hypothetical protein C8J57DRAFT_1084107 [Mycena rebaudengoi]